MLILFLILPLVGILLTSVKVKGPADEPTATSNCLDFDEGCTVNPIFCTTRLRTCIIVRTHGGVADKKR